MDAETLAFTPAVTVAELIRTKQLSPVEYMQALLDGSNALEPTGQRVRAISMPTGDGRGEARPRPR